MTTRRDETRRDETTNESGRGSEADTMLYVLLVGHFEDGYT